MRGQRTRVDGGPTLIPLRALARRSGRFPPLPCPPPRLRKCTIKDGTTGENRSTFVTVLIRRFTVCESLRLRASSMCPLDLALWPGVILIMERRGVPQDDRTDFIGVGRIAPERGRVQRSAGVHEGTG